MIQSPVWEDTVPWFQKHAEWFLWHLNLSVQERHLCMQREEVNYFGSTQIQHEATLAQWILALFCHRHTGAPKDSQAPA